MTSVTPMLSEADADTEAVPRTVALDEGEVRETRGEPEVHAWLKTGDPPVQPEGMLERTVRVSVSSDW